MNEESLACELFEKKYFETIEKNGEAYKQYDSLLTSVFNKNPEDKSYKSPVTTIDKFEFENNDNLCSKCEDVSDKEFAEFLDLFSSKNQASSMPSTKFQPQFKYSETSSTKPKNIYYPSDEHRPHLSNKNDEIDFYESTQRNRSCNYSRNEVQAESRKNNVNAFKTANDELQLQNNKRFGHNTNLQSSNNNGGGLSKRRLGTCRRNVRSSFVSPLFSNNSSSNEDIRSNSNQEPVDERLKNIEPEMVELIKSEIMDCGPSISWDDIAGLEFAKTAIQEAVVWPMLRPDIFTGLRRPPKGILLFGPPGTGKTLIGKCVASQSKSTFFSISASSLTSKWIGNGEKMVRALFAVARVHQPSVIFIDEIDSLLSQRNDTEHESSRRIKTEFLVQLDGATTDNEERILVIGATNRPQELDEAARRRLVKRLYIPLPEYEARLQLVHKLISKERHTLEKADFEKVARLSDGYSGADIKNLCSEASLGPIRAIDMRLIQKIQAADVRPLIMSDFEMAFTRVKSSIALNDLDQYRLYDKTYGSGTGF